MVDFNKVMTDYEETLALLERTDELWERIKGNVEDF